MSSVRPRRRFALDHNFPEPVLNAIATALPMAELVLVRAIQAELSEVDDWQLLLALYRDARGWDGLITHDANMRRLLRRRTQSRPQHPLACWPD